MEYLSQCEYTIPEHDVCLKECHDILILLILPPDGTIIMTHPPLPSQHTPHPSLNSTPSSTTSPRNPISPLVTKSVGSNGSIASSASVPPNVHNKLVSSSASSLPSVVKVEATSRLHKKQQLVLVAAEPSPLTGQHFLCTYLAHKILPCFYEILRKQAPFTLA